MFFMTSAVPAGEGLQGPPKSVVTVSDAQRFAYRWAPFLFLLQPLWAYPYATPYYGVIDRMPHDFLPGFTGTIPGDTGLTDGPVLPYLGRMEDDVNKLAVVMGHVRVVPLPCKDGSHTGMGGLLYRYVWVRARSGPHCEKNKRSLSGNEILPGTRKPDTWKADVETVVFVEFTGSKHLGHPIRAAMHYNNMLLSDFPDWGKRSFPGM
eukprot:jgi/Tetstr1/461660/TSEL_006760.t1